MASTALLRSVCKGVVTVPQKVLDHLSKTQVAHGVLAMGTAQFMPALLKTKALPRKCGFLFTNKPMLFLGKKVVKSSTSQSFPSS